MLLFSQVGIHKGTLTDQGMAFVFSWLICVIWGHLSTTPRLIAWLNDSNTEENALVVVDEEGGMWHQPSVYWPQGPLDIAHELWEEHPSPHQLCAVNYTCLLPAVLPVPANIPTKASPQKHPPPTIQLCAVNARTHWQSPCYQSQVKIPVTGAGLVYRPQESQPKLTTTCNSQVTTQTRSYTMLTCLKSGGNLLLWCRPLLFPPRLHGACLGSEKGWSYNCRIWVVGPECRLIFLNHGAHVVHHEI